MGRTWILVALFFGIVAASATSACTVDEGPLLGELLREGQSVVVVTPTVITAPAPSNLKADDPDGIVINFLAPAIAKVRIVEVLVGAAPALEEMSYLFSWCGGHRLEVDRYYVLAVPASEKTHRIKLGGNELLGIGDEYLEQTGSGKSSSKLIQALLSYKQTGTFGMNAESLRPFREIALPRGEYPSGG